MHNRLPNSNSLEKALFEALKQLGGSANSKTLDQKIIEILNLPSDVIELIHSGNRTEISYRLAWIRSKVKKQGKLSRDSKGNWVIN